MSIIVSTYILSFNENLDINLFESCNIFRYVCMFLASPSIEVSKIMKRNTYFATGKLCKKN